IPIGTEMRQIERSRSQTKPNRTAASTSSGSVTLTLMVCPITDLEFRFPTSLLGDNLHGHHRVHLGVQVNGYLMGTSAPDRLGGNVPPVDRHAGQLLAL